MVAIATGGKAGGGGGGALRQGGPPPLAMSVVRTFARKERPRDDDADADAYEFADAYPVDPLRASTPKKQRTTPPLGGAATALPTGGGVPPALLIALLWRYLARTSPILHPHYHCSATIVHRTRAQLCRRRHWRGCGPAGPPAAVGGQRDQHLYPDDLLVCRPLHRPAI